MKILLVVHDFLPGYYGGTEVYTYNMAKELGQEHEVHVFFCEPLSQKQPLYKLNQIDNYGGFTGWQFEKDILKYTSYTQTYLDSKVAPLFDEVLRKIKPDIVHFHHLLHLSTDLAGIPRKLHIPSLYTFHDFWIQCHETKRIDLNGNQCLKINPRNCAKCMLRYMDPHTYTESARQKTAKWGKLIYKKLWLENEKYQTKLIQKESFALALEEVKRREKYVRSNILNCDLFIAPTYFLYDEFAKWGIPKSRLIYSADGIDDSSFTDINKTASTNFRLAYIGAIMPSKGLHVLVDAFLRTDPKLDITLDIYGDLKTDPPYSKTLQEKTYGNKKIFFKGTFPPSDIAKIFQGIDCLIVPSIWFENAPLVVKNALLAKTPQIASDIPGVKDSLTNNENCLLFTPGNSLELARQIALLATDKALYQKLKSNITPPKNIRENAKEMIGLYQNLIQTYD